MSTTAQAAIWGLLAGLPLFIGAAIAIWKRPSDRVVGLVAALGAGALVSAVAYELVEEAAGQADPWLLGLSLATGALVYFFGDRALSSGGGSSRGLALLLGATLDGIPESLILGISIAAGGGVSIAYFAAIVLSNFPEGMASAAELKDDPDFPPKKLLGMWAVVVVVVAIAAALGGALGQYSPYLGALAMAFAAGALLTMLTDDLIPEAREKGGLAAGLVVVLGFALAFALNSLE